MRFLEWIRSWFRPSLSWTVQFRWTGDKEPSMGNKFGSPQAFVDAIRPPALTLEQKTGIPWKFAAAQAAHESRYGNSKLAVDANNLFGVTGDSWKLALKPVYEIKTTEYDGNVAHEEVRPFRKYASYEECLFDWAQIIERLYPDALRAARIGDFAAFADGLQHGVLDKKGQPLRWATDPHYVVALNTIHAVIETTA